MLPIHDILTDVKTLMANHPAVVLQAPPGAGKSTVLPLELVNESWLDGKKILMLEPRRLAARAVAARMASLLNENVGDTVGYRVRFDTKVGKNTRIEVLTEGILTRMIQSDNALEEAGLVIFDEFHERSLHADLALVMCRQVREFLRPDLKILIMSATIDAAQLSKWAGDAPIITSQGRQFPVDIRYSPYDTEMNAAVKVVRGIQRALREEQGDILAFLPGAGEILSAVDLLDEAKVPAVIYPLYGDLPQREQQAAITPDPNGRRKIVLATSIAETSLTIEGIHIVVDGGLARVPRFDPRSGFSRLETVQVTRDSADQRAGRAGRLGPGVCYRLWDKSVQLHAQRTPEILAADLAPVVLELAEWGVSDIMNLPWPTLPVAGVVAQAADILEQLGALSQGKITARGKEMLRLPTHPRIAHLLLESSDWNLKSLAADVAALLEERDPMPRETGADLSYRVEILRKWRKKEQVFAERNVLERIEQLANNWRRLLHVQPDNANPSPSDVGRLIASAYPERIAKRSGAGQTRYRLSNGRTASIAQHDPLVHEEWLAVAQLDAGTGEGKIFLASPLDPDDLKERITLSDSVRWDAREGVLVAQREKRVGGLLLESVPFRNIPTEEATPVLLQAVRENPRLLNWTDEIEAWKDRVLSLRTWRPTEAWPDVTTAGLMASAEEWLAPFISKVRSKNDFAKIELKNLLSGLLPWPLPQRLDELAPTHLSVPSGSRIKLQYFPDGAQPVLAVRLQEMFGLLETPTVNDGRNKVLLHLLSPAYRPVQVTQDLKSFWQNTYPEVRKELRGRYPKHHWPEDPWTAEAVRGVKRKK